MMGHRIGNGNVYVKSSGTHNEFPAYESIGNGSVLYKDYPADSTPGILNLGVFWDKFETDWIQINQ